MPMTIVNFNQSDEQPMEYTSATNDLWSHRVEFDVNNQPQPYTHHIKLVSRGDGEDKSIRAAFFHSCIPDCVMLEDFLPQQVISVSSRNASFRMLYCSCYETTSDLAPVWKEMDSMEEKKR